MQGWPGPESGWWVGPAHRRQAVLLNQFERELVAGQRLSPPVGGYVLVERAGVYVSHAGIPGMWTGARFC